MTINEAKEFYLGKLEGNDYSPLTINLYGEAIDDFSAQLGIENLEDIDGPTLLRYRELVAKKDESYKTKNLRIIPVRGMLRCLSLHQKSSISESVLETFKGKNGKKPMDLISREELQAYLSYKDNPRDDFLVNFLYSTGLRLAEACALEVSDVKQKFEVRGKGGRERMIFVGDDVMTMFSNYVGVRNEGPLFLSARGQRLSKIMVQRIVKERGEKLGMSKIITPHTLRHLYATHLYENGADLMALKEMLGHSSLNTTQRYTHVNVERMEEVYKNSHGLKKAER